MSHVVSVDVEFKDLAALKAACEALGWAFNEGATSYTWYGRWVDDSPLPVGLLAPDEHERVKNMSKAARITYMNALLGKCEHEIRVPGAGYSIGIVKKANGQWTMLWDWYDHSLCKLMGGNDGRVLRQAYGVAKTTIEARKQGYRVQQTKRPDGTVRLTLQR